MLATNKVRRIEIFGLERFSLCLYRPDAFAMSELSKSSPESATVQLPAPNQFGLRLVLIGCGGLLLGLLLVTRFLVPEPVGLGTHEQLGLPECGFLMVTGYPCPSCGMTTSWAWLTRGDLMKSIRSNAGGTMLGILCLVFGVWMLISGIRGRWFMGVPTSFWLFVLLGSTVGVTLIGWVNKIWY